MTKRKKGTCIYLSQSTNDWLLRFLFSHYPTAETYCRTHKGQIFIFPILQAQIRYILNRSALSLCHYWSEDDSRDGSRNGAASSSSQSTSKPSGGSLQTFAWTLCLSVQHWFASSFLSIFQSLLVHSLSISLSSSFHFYHYSHHLPFCYNSVHHSDIMCWKLMAGIMRTRKQDCLEAGFLVCVCVSECAPSMFCSPWLIK